MDNSTLEQRIERMKKRNEFFYDEDIAFCIRSLEVWQNVREEIDNLEWYGDVAFWNGIDACKAIIDKALEEIEKGEE